MGRVAQHRAGSLSRERRPSRSTAMRWLIPGPGRALVVLLAVGGLVAIPIVLVAGVEVTVATVAGVLGVYVMFAVMGALISVWYLALRGSW